MQSHEQKQFAVGESSPQTSLDPDTLTPLSCVYTHRSRGGWHVVTVRSHVHSHLAAWALQVGQNS